MQGKIRSGPEGSEILLEGMQAVGVQAEAGGTKETRGLPGGPEEVQAEGFPLTVSGSNRRSAVQFFNGSAQEEPAPEDSVLEVSLDRLTIVGDVKDKGALAEYVSADPVVLTPSRSKVYRYAFNLVGEVGRIEFEPYYRDRPFLRFEFNPKHDDERIRIERLKVLQLFRNPRFTRTDVAIDTSMDVSRLNLVDEKFRSRNVRLDRWSRPETVYLGARTSDSMIRIYNKKAEMEREGRECPHSVMWRFEAELKREKANLLVDASQGDFNPFEGIKVVGTIQAGLDVEERIVLERLYQEPQLLSEMSPYKRRKYRKLMEQASTVEFEPAKVFERKRAELRERLRRLLTEYQV